jgi:hypothetical protein
MNDMPVIHRTNLSPGKRKGRYNFDALKHGDAIEVANKDSAQLMFTRWKRAKGRAARLVSSTRYPRILYFLDDTSLV